MGEGNSPIIFDMICIFGKVLSGKSKFSSNKVNLISELNSGYFGTTSFLNAPL